LGSPKPLIRNKVKHSLIILIYLLLGRMGKYNGQGTFTYPDGNKYVGGWKDGEI